MALQTPLATPPLDRIRSSAPEPSTSAPAEPSTHTYRVWDLTVRLTHWTMVLSFLFLTITGVIILYSAELDIKGPAKIGMKVIHVWAGYICAAAVLLRVVYGFMGSASSRWTRILPFGGFFGELRAYMAASKAGRRPHYAGHNPVGRLMVTALMALLLVQVATGLVIGSTDTYMWPFGDYIRAWVAAPGVDPATLIAGTKTGVDEMAWQEMRSFRYPFYITHEYTFYMLAALVVVHVAGVVWLEVKGRTPVVSAMITGEKTLPGKATDV